MNYLRILAGALFAISLFSVESLAQESGRYIFRYKTALQAQDTPVNEFEPGNDIETYFISVVGNEFSKRIPVATENVFLWKVDSGELPIGIDIADETGFVSGRTSHPQKTVGLFYGYDVTGNRIARARIHFESFEPSGHVYRAEWYAHTDTYFFNKINPTMTAPVAEWKTITPLAKGTSIRDSAYEGRPVQKGVTSIGMRGFDYSGREIAFTYGDLLVEDGPKVEFIPDQTIDKAKGDAFSVQAMVKHSLGKLTFSLQPVGSNPSGLKFSSDTGVISGAFDKFDTTAQYRIEARDSADGTTSYSNVFSLSTKPAYVKIDSLPDVVAVRGSVFESQIDPQFSGELSYSVVGGRLPNGVSLSEREGTIKGRPSELGVFGGIIIQVAGPGFEPVRSNPFQFKVIPEGIEAYTKLVSARVGKGFVGDAPIFKSGKTSNVVFSSTTLPDGVELNDRTGVISSAGIPVAGVFDFDVNIRNENGHSVTVPQTIKVYPEPSVAYTASTSLKRYQELVLSPVFPGVGVYGPTTFIDANGNFPSWMELNHDKGTISLKPVSQDTIGTFGPFQVQLQDGFGDVALSQEFSVTVADRDAIRIEVKSTDVERFVLNSKDLFDVENAIGTVRLSIIQKPSNWPSTLDFLNSGVLFGTTTDAVGTVYSGLLLRVTDADNYSELVGPFELTVTEPGGLEPLNGSFDRAFQWTRGQPLRNYKLPQLANAYGASTYKIEGTDVSLSVQDGYLSGTFPREGVFPVHYTIRDQTERTPVSGTISFTIIPPVEIEMPKTLVANRGSSYSIPPKVTNGIPPFEFALDSGSKLPNGMTFNDHTGVISGIPKVEGVYPLSVSVTDYSLATATTGLQELKVEKPLPFEVNYDNSYISVNRNTIKAPVVKGQSGTVKWELLQGTLPPGIQFNSSGIYQGSFTGVATKVGGFGGIRVKATDLETGQVSEVDVVLNVAYEEDAQLGDKVLKLRAGSVSRVFDNAGRYIVSPARYSFAGGTPYADNVLLNSQTGALTVQFPTAGLYKGYGVRVVDLFGRQASSTVVFDVFGTFEVKADQSYLFKAFRSASYSIQAINPVGSLRYRLASGVLPAGVTINAETGAISGRPNEAGEFGPIQIEAVDTYDNSVALTQPFSINVVARDPLQLTGPDTFVFKQYSSNGVKLTTDNAIDGVSYSISPALPPGLSIDVNTGEIAGRPTAKVALTNYVVTVTDGQGGKAAHTITLAVVDRDLPKVTTSPSQIGLLNRPFVLNLQSSGTIGSVSYVITGTLPSGLTFDGASKISGIPTVYGQNQTIVAKVVDTFDGVSTPSDPVSISINILQDGTAITLSSGQTTVRVGQQSSTAPAAVGNVVGQPTFSVAGLEGTGMNVDPLTGALVGKPSRVGSWAYTLTVTDVTGRKASISRTLEVVPPISINFSNELDLTYNYTFEKANVAQPAATKTVGAVTWSLTGEDTLPEGIQFDASTGKFIGSPKQIGAFGPVTITVKDSLAGSTSIGPIWFSVFMNDDPIDLIVSDFIGKIGYPISTRLPLFNNVLGSHRFYSLDIGRTPLKIDTVTGVLSGTIGTPTEVDVNVAITDDTLRVTSKPVRIQILPKMKITAPQEIVIAAQESMTPVSFATANAIGKLTWHQNTVSDILPGVSFNPATGRLEGAAENLGTFGPFEVSATDSLGDRATSNSFNIVSRPGTYFLSLSDGTLPNGMLRVQPYSFDFKQLILPGNIVGMDISEVAWSMLSLPGEALPGGLTLNASTGVLSGVPTKSGTYNFQVKASGKGKQSVKTFKLTVDKPDIDIKFLSSRLPDGYRRTPYAFDVSSVVELTNIPKDKVTFTAKPVPSFSYPTLTIGASTGLLTGSPTAGEFKLEVFATFSAGEEQLSKSQIFDLKVDGPVYKFADLAIGDAFGCGINNSGKVVCWGDGSYGQLGSANPNNPDAGKLNFSLDPVEVAGLPGGATSITASLNTVCATFGSGDVYCWGDSRYGQGGNTQSVNFKPVKIGLDSVTRVSTSGINTCGVRSGEVYCWGHTNAYYPVANTLLMNGTPNKTTLKNVTDVSLAQYMLCVVGASGQNVGTCHGYGVSIGTVSTSTPFVAAYGSEVCYIDGGQFRCRGTRGVILDSGVKSSSNPISVAGGNTCWITSKTGTDQLLCAGANYSNPGIVVPNVAGPKKVVSAPGFQCVLEITGQAKCWGSNVNGQLGDGTRISSASPVLVGG